MSIVVAPSIFWWYFFPINSLMVLKTAGKIILKDF